MSITIKETWVSSNATRVGPGQTPGKLFLVSLPFHIWLSPRPDSFISYIFLRSICSFHLESFYPQISSVVSYWVCSNPWVLCQSVIMSSVYVPPRASQGHHNDPQTLPVLALPIPLMSYFCTLCLFSILQPWCSRFCSHPIFAWLPPMHLSVLKCFLLKAGLSY